MPFRGSDKSRAQSPTFTSDAEVTRLRGRYLDLVKSALTHLLYRPLDVRFENAGYVVEDDEAMREAVVAEFSKKDFDWADVRADGRDWPRFAQTMVGMKRLDNVQYCVETALADGVPGDLIETGVWRGGVIILMRAILDAYADTDRVVFAADSFCGLPAPDDAYPADAKSRLHEAEPLAIGRDEVERNIGLYGLLDQRVRFLEGWFKDTLPSVAKNTWSVIRLDGDMYESTMDALTNLYPNLSPGGFLIVDDYTYEPCKRAVSDYRDAHGIREPIEMVDWLGAFWRRES
jgi:O-methyltransferase